MNSLNQICQRLCKHFVLIGCFVVLLAGCLDDKKDVKESASVSGFHATVSVQEKTLEAQDGIYLVPNGAKIDVQCSEDCIFALQENGAQIKQSHTENRRWAGVLQFSDQNAQIVITVTATANGKRPVVMTFQSHPVKKTSGVEKGTWALNNLAWQRGKSMQQAFPAKSVSGSVPWMSLVMESDNFIKANCSVAAPCSIVDMFLEGTVEPGDYTIDPYWLTKPTNDPNGVRMNVKVLSGLGRAAMADYRPVSGMVRITKDAAGVYHYSTISPMVVRRLSGGGTGMSNLPDQMVFSMNNGY